MPVKKWLSAGGTANNHSNHNHNNNNNNSSKQASTTTPTKNTANQSNGNGNAGSRWRLPGRRSMAKRFAEKSSKENMSPPVESAPSTPATPLPFIPDDVPTPQSMGELKPAAFMKSLESTLDDAQLSQQRKQSRSKSKPAPRRLHSTSSAAARPVSPPIHELVFDPTASPPSPMRDDPTYDIVRHPAATATKTTAALTTVVNKHSSSTDSSDGKRSAGSIMLIKAKTQLWDAQRLVKVILGKEELDGTSTLQAIRAYAMLKQELVQCQTKVSALEQLEQRQQTSQPESSIHDCDHNHRDNAADAASDASCTGSPSSPVLSQHDRVHPLPTTTPPEEDCEQCAGMAQAIAQLSDTCEAYQEQQTQWQTTLQDVMGRLQQTPRKALTTEQATIIQERVQLLLEQLAKRHAQAENEQLQKQLEEKDRRIAELEELVSRQQGIISTPTREMAESENLTTLNAQIQEVTPTQMTPSRESQMEAQLAFLLRQVGSNNGTNPQRQHQRSTEKSLHSNQVEEEKKEDSATPQLPEISSLETRLEVSQRREMAYQQQVQELRAQIQSMQVQSREESPAFVTSPASTSAASSTSLNAGNFLLQPRQLQSDKIERRLWDSANMLESHRVLHGFSPTSLLNCPTPHSVGHRSESSAPSIYTSLVAHQSLQVAKLQKELQSSQAQNQHLQIKLGGLDAATLKNASASKSPAKSPLATRILDSYATDDVVISLDEAMNRA